MSSAAPLLAGARQTTADIRDLNASRRSKSTSPTDGPVNQALLAELSQELGTPEEQSSPGPPQHAMFKGGSRSDSSLKSVHGAASSSGGGDCGGADGAAGASGELPPG